MLYFIFGEKKQGCFLKQLNQGFNSSFPEQYFLSPTNSSIIQIFNTFIEYSLCYQYPIILEVGDEMVNETLHDWPF